MDIRVSPLGELWTIVEGSTPDLVLIEAGRLFSTRGFHGTSTREIAAAVGIRQPSLFHHFASKAVIAQYLLEYDRLRSPLLQGHAGPTYASPSARLFQTLRTEIAIELTSRYELRGLYLSDTLEEKEFEFWKVEYDRAIERLRALVVEGIDAGEFVPVSAEMVTQLLDAILMGVVSWNKHRVVNTDADEIASFFMRSLLANPMSIAAILASLETPSSGT